MRSCMLSERRSLASSTALIVVLSTCLAWPSSPLRRWKIQSTSVPQLVTVSCSKRRASALSLKAETRFLFRPASLSRMASTTSGVKIEVRLSTTMERTPDPTMFILSSPAMFSATT